MLKYLKKYWLFAILAPLFMVGEVLADLVQPRLMSTIVDEGVLGLSNNGVGNLNLVLTEGLKMIIFVILGGLSGILCGVCSNIASQNFGNDLRKDAFKKIMSFSFEQTDKFSTGSLITRITNDITQLQNFIQMSMRGFIRTFMLFAGGIICMLSLNLSFGAVIACALPLVTICVIYFLSKANPLFSKLQQKLDNVNNVMQENVSGFRVVKAYVKEDYEKERFGKSNDDLVNTQLNVLMIFSYMQPIMNIILNLSVVAVIKVGASLSAAELLSICSLLEAAKRVKAFSRSEKEEVPDDSLTGFFTEIEPLTPLYDEIKRCILAEDEIADDASSTLRSIRRSMRGMNDRIRAQMNNMINNSTTRSYLQDAVITMRDGRYCLPVKAEAKSQIPGMVHDQSSSGSTLFIEPMAVVNLNNEYKELLLKEKDEIEKILENLSNLTANFSEQIAADYTILAELDFIFAKAAYAQTYNGVAPTFNNEG